MFKVDSEFLALMVITMSRDTLIEWVLQNLAAIDESLRCARLTPDGRVVVPCVEWLPLPTAHKRSGTPVERTRHVAGAKAASPRRARVPRSSASRAAGQRTKASHS